MSKITLRCAIYTRKSTEEGLEQEFNSLDAQREACAAFITSQLGQGWKELSKLYDDGGISGGTMERPALLDLLADIKAGKVDVVVVYKIDRLTRSLMDFAKIVEVFDAHKVSFVSVTQQFNTLSSMGRLTLNVLLSFAQFEREVTAERIRDKVAASKSKGMWMGGPSPIGYVVREKKLIIDPEGAETVRQIYAQYAELGSVRKLKDHLDRAGLLTKRRIRKDGTPSGGKTFGRGHLQWILANPIYVGLMTHKGKISEGQHEAIIARDTWDATQLLLTNKAPRERKATDDQLKVANQGNSKNSNRALLSGILYDETGDRVTPSFANKAGVRYRYYVSMRLLHEGKKDSSGWRLPAKPLEEVVLKELGLLLADQQRLHAVFNMGDMTIPALEKVAAKAKLLSVDLVSEDHAKAHTVRHQIIDRITLAPELLTIALNRQSFAALLDLHLDDSTTEEKTCNISVPFALKRRGNEAKLIIGEHSEETNLVDETLIKIISNAHRWMQQLQSGAATTVVEIAKAETLDDGEISRVLPLAFLAPDIVEAILDGRHPLNLTARDLKRLKPMPTSWANQRQILGFPAKI
jgi:site-specific DNA recombinase